MVLADIDRPAVEATLREFDDLGRTQFLTRYGFGEATTYLLRHEGHFYDPKAVLGVAHRGVDQRPLRANEFDATEAIAQLQRIGFEILPFNGLWWVNQGDSYKIERDGGFVWAPQHNKAGNPVGHHVNVNRLRVGQRIVHYADNNIRALGTVAEAPYTSPQPEALRRDTWVADGYLCPVDYRELPSVIHRLDLPGRTEIPGAGPFDVNGNVKQGYMFPISPDYLFTLLEFLDTRIPDLFGSEITNPHYVYEGLMAALSLEPPENPITEALVSFKNVVLEGVPGTGKSYAVEQVAADWSRHTGRELVDFDGIPFRAIVLHPSSSYEDFVEGLRPASGPSEGVTSYFDEAAATTGGFSIADGFFVSVCAQAAATPHKDVLVLLDELNRCNVPSVFGDLLLTLEKSRRASYRGPDIDPSRGSVTARDWAAVTPVTLPYSGRRFFVPDNVYVIATMNTTDRSVAPLDAALRRRFAFVRLEPQMPDGDIVAARLPAATRNLFTTSLRVLHDLNEHALGPCLGPDAPLGHSYLYAIATNLNSAADAANGAGELRKQWRYAILPQLIDSVRSLGAEDLLSPKTRNEWLGRHSELAPVADTAQLALEQLDDFLQGSMDLRIVVDGVGLSRGARIEDHTVEDL